ncbi:MAG: glutamyl-tRNA amidotransferase [Bacteroidetes bacterium QH_8_67_23]|nr:MAG: glutamyl-tRNA amidotransferase [Bacteroidetes bacterium QH_8_67_23]
MLEDQIADDLKAAMRAKDDARRRALRSLRAALAEKARAGGELAEEDERKVLQKQAKQRREALQQYEDAGRDDLAEKERAELAVIEDYLPERLGDEELDRELEAIIEETGAASMSDMGRVMGTAMDRLRGRAQGGRVQKHVKALLSKSIALPRPVINS